MEAQKKKDFNVITPYFHDRAIKIWKDVERNVGGGVPQGSVLGPILWNILYDDIMDINMGKEVELVCYADDLAIVICVDTINRIMECGNRSLFLVNTWMKINGLSPKTKDTTRSGWKKKLNMWE